jgi:hypothetical protein
MPDPLTELERVARSAWRHTYPPDRSAEAEHPFETRNIHPALFAGHLRSVQVCGQGSWPFSEQFRKRIQAYDGGALGCFAASKTYSLRDSVRKRRAEGISISLCRFDVSCPKPPWPRAFSKGLSGRVSRPFGFGLTSTPPSPGRWLHDPQALRIDISRDTARSSG